MQTMRSYHWRQGGRIHAAAHNDAQVGEWVPEAYPATAVPEIMALAVARDEARDEWRKRHAASIFAGGELRLHADFGLVNGEDAAAAIERLAAEENAALDTLLAAFDAACTVSPELAHDICQAGPWPL